MLALLVTGWLAGWLLCWRLRALPPCPSGGGASTAIVVPARDEARTLPALLSDLAEDGQDAMALVVDDRSDDNTACVVRARGVRLLVGEPPPSGWAGKPWACWQGARATSASVLVFLDADVRLGRGAIDALVAAHGRVGGLLSVAPQHRPAGLIEQLSLLPNVVAVMGSGAALPWPASAPMAFGPCLVTSRNDYERVGGHRAVRGSVLEDVDLGRRYIEAGLPVTVKGGGDLLGYRMYPGGFGSLVEGWTKNLAVGASRIPLWRTFGVALWVAAMLTAAFEAAAASVAGAVAYVGFALQVEVLAHRVGRFARGVGVAYPVLGTAFVALFALAFLKLARGSARWKGRLVPLRR